MKSYSKKRRKFSFLKSSWTRHKLFLEIREHKKAKQQKQYSYLKEFREWFLDTHGYVFCEKCDRSNAFMFHVHHIVFRSEAPKHPELHNKRNLLSTCDECHNEAHGKKREWRKDLIKERELDKLFPECKGLI